MAVAILALAVQRAGTPVSAPVLQVANVVADRRSFRPAAGERVTWRFRTSAAARVSALLYDARDVLVRALEQDADRPSGDHQIAWDGKDDTGREAPPGYYLLAIEARAGSEMVRYDPGESTGGEAFQAAVGYDPGRRAVRYALQRPALVRILLGLKRDGPLLRTLVDWVARAPGEHEEPWDGWDASGVVRFADSRELDVQVWAYELPVNAVVVEAPAATAPKAPASSAPPDPASLAPVRLSFLDFGADRPRRPRAAGRVPEMYNHWQHDRARCHDPRIGLRVAGEARRDDKGAVIVGGPLRLQVEVPAGEAAFLQDERFEAVVYLDGSFVFEEEQGYLPFTWTLRPEILTPGEHVVTLMIRGYEGHFGTASLRVARPKAGSAAARS